MAKDRRAKATGKKGNAAFLGIPHCVLNSDAYKTLNGWDVKLLIDISVQFTGFNNGDLNAVWSQLQHKGWNSKGTLNSALKKLQEVGLIEQTRLGGKNRCSLYAITWRAIDECKGKLDVKETQSPSNRYRLYGQTQQ
ncbi:MAG: hypothetical protein IBX52_07615 [Bacterioplanes sp.]|nr:hypothetical protein [Bacterioplanes sp.]